MVPSRPIVIGAIAVISCVHRTCLSESTATTPAVDETYIASAAPRDNTPRSAPSPGRVTIHDRPAHSIVCDHSEDQDAVWTRDEEREGQKTYRWMPSRS